MNNNKSVGVVVLGDVGRSPRMQYHCYSLRREGFQVKLIGYNDTKVSPTLLRDVSIVNVNALPSLHVPKLFEYVLKVVWNTVFLFYALVSSGRFNTLLVQNPPSIPTLFVCWFYCKLFRAKLIVDWHNYAYTILALTLGPRAPLVRISKSFEKYFGRMANHNICVTAQMKEDLKVRWNIEAITLYDKPGPQFTPSISAAEKRHLFEKLANLYPQFGSLLDTNSSTGLLVSSTSWTEDEDFGILLDALCEYEKAEGDLKPLLCVITGKGPLKNHYQEKIKQISWIKVSIVTPWLENEDYPRLLASADLGVCLHKSSSGLDLPMKVVDMFGCGLPVCAYNYKCLSELVRRDENGLLFETSTELACHIKRWFSRQSDVAFQSQLRKSIDEWRKTGWHENWKDNATVLFSN